MHQTTHAVVRRELRAGLLDTHDRPGAEGVGSVVYRAAAALYALLLEHPVDRRGRCCLCRRSTAVLRRRHCRIYPVVQYWLHQPGIAVLVSRLATELGLMIQLPPLVGPELDRPGVTIVDRARAQRDDPAAQTDLDDTDVLAQVSDASDDFPTIPQSPVAQSPPFLPGGFPRTGRPDPDHGGAGESTSAAPLASPWPIHPVVLM